MRKLLRRVCFRGFTLIELLVVISIIAILAAVLTPAVTSALTRGKMTGTMNNGRSIYMSLFAKDVEDPVFQTGSPFPKSTGSSFVYTKSTDYFIWVVTSKVMSVDYSFFSASGIPPAKTTVAADFKAENNAWCITADVADSTPDGVPLLITRNLNITALNTPLTAGILSGEPFGEKGAVIVTKGGASLIAKEDNLSQVFAAVTTNNPVLRP